MPQQETMRELRAKVLKELRSYAAKSCDSELIRISNKIQYVFGDNYSRVVTYLERSNRSKESSAIVYSEEVDNPNQTGQFHLRFGGYESTGVTQFYKPLAPHEIPESMNFVDLIKGDE